MARARRRRKGTWFPNLGTAGPGEEIDDDDLGVWGSVPVGAVGLGNNFTTTTLVVPLTFDAIEEDNLDEQTDRLGDIIGSEYMLRRIVGDLYVARSFARDANAAGGPPAIKVSAGFFVARQADSTQSLDQPIGSNTASELRENYSPSQASIVREPWIWRKTWILGRSTFTATVGAVPAPFSFTENNVNYNGALSNSRVDAKTIRRVRQDDRLWFAIAARGLNANWANPFVNEVLATGAATVEFHLDYRLFGTLMRAKNRGAF